MPLRIHHPPKEAVAAFFDRLEEFLAAEETDSVLHECHAGAKPPIPSAAHLGLKRDRGNEDRPALALPVFSLSLQQASGRGAFSPTHAGWSFFVAGEEHKTIAGRVVHKQHGWKLISVNYREPLVEQTLRRALDLIESPPAETRDRDYDLRLLEIPAVNANLYWLATRQKSAGLILSAPGAVTESIFNEFARPLELPSLLAHARRLASTVINMGPTSGG